MESRHNTEKRMLVTQMKLVLVIYFNCKTKSMARWDRQLIIVASCSAAAPAHLSCPSILTSILGPECEYK